MSSSPSCTTSIESSIRRKLKNALSPVFLDVQNESSKHNVPKGSESHFKVTIVSDQFTGKKALKRHRMVNDLLKVQFYLLINFVPK
jgi:BolA protein